MFFRNGEKVKDFDYLDVRVSHMFIDTRYCISGIMLKCHDIALETHGEHITERGQVLNRNN